MAQVPEKREQYLPPTASNLDPVLDSVKRRFRLDEEFKTFLDRNENVRNSKPDVGFLLFLLEQQREAIINLELRVRCLETGKSYAERLPFEFQTASKEEKLNWEYCKECDAMRKKGHRCKDFEMPKI